MTTEPDDREGGNQRQPPKTDGREDGPFRPELIWREQMKGTRPGDRRVRIIRHRLFREAGPGLLAPRPRATEPRGGFARLWWRLQRLLLGAPIPTHLEIEERLTRVKALAVLSSDALSSVAYGPEAVMRTVVLAGVAALSLTLPITMVIALLLAIVATSYRQTIRAYPHGGGSYSVSRDNLGDLPGLIAAAALLTDYILTVAVSISAGVAAISSAFPQVRPYVTEVAVASVLLIALVNLRGIRESGTVFAAPTYVFVFSVLGLITFGAFRLFTGGIGYAATSAPSSAGSEPLTWFLILSAFAKGCTAMTGTEAISNGVPAFKPPEAENARATLTVMATLLGTMLLGIAFLVSQIGIVPDPTERETVLSQLTHLVVGDGWYYYLLQFATALILFLAANTSYADFPRLLSLLARDRFAPRWFGLRGSRLAFTVGIAALTAFAVSLLLIFSASTDRLLPLYAVGVFTSFTLSQSGMVVHWLRGQAPDRVRGAVVNGVGAVMTSLVTLVIAGTKFLEGAWIVIVVAALLVSLFLLIHKHYVTLARQLRTDVKVTPLAQPPVVVVPVPSLSLVVRQALGFASGVSKNVVAVHVATDPPLAERLRAEWPEVAGNIPLVIIESPYRLLLPPLLAYIDALRDAEPGRTIEVVLPEFVPRHWWENLLHNQTALRLKGVLLYREGIVVTSFPYHLEA
ncbi:MAG: APC family permease [Chloroflexi bacterium]|nr:APC family permease [Chloroflexota bacterium]